MDKGDEVRIAKVAIGQAGEFVVAVLEVEGDTDPGFPICSVTARLYEESATMRSMFSVMAQAGGKHMLQSVLGQPVRLSEAQYEPGHEPKVDGNG